MNSSAPNSTGSCDFTIAELAETLGMTRPNVARMLAGVEPTGSKIVSGNEARTFGLGQLPTTLRTRLETVRRQEGCRTAAEAVRQRCTTWAPSIPMADCHNECLAQARKLREALRPALARQNAPGFNSTELEALGIEDFRRVFGYTVSARHWRNLFTRTLRRAGTNADMDRLEIYLPDRLRRRESVARPLPIGASETETRLASFVSVIADADRMTSRHRERIWDEALLEYQALLDRGTPARRAGTIVRTALQRVAPFIATTPEGLRKTLARKISSGSGTDHRHQVDDVWELPEEDRNILTHLAVWKNHGSMQAAWLHACANRMLTSETAARYPNTLRVPAKVAEAIGSEVELFMLMKRTKHAADELTPYVDRVHDGIYSGQIYQGDDFTMPVYFTVPDGQGWFNLLRGQVLLFIDFRSSKIVGWCLIPEAQYSSLNIWTQLKQIFREHGIPDVLYFERGIWKRSSLLTGRKGDPSTGEVVQGLRELGIKFKHAIRPRSKTVERIGGLIQDLMEGEPGYCGRDERRDLPAATKQALQRVKSRKVDPAGLFYTFEQWNARLGEIIAQYNARPQHGKQLAGLSPDQAFDQFMEADKERRRHDLELSFLLTHKEEKEVKPGQSIKFTVGKNTFRYYGPELAPFMGRRVIAAFDAENPEHLIVTDLRQKDIVLVPLANSVSAAADLLGAEAQETLAHELGRANGQMSHTNARYNVVKSTLPMRRPDVESLNGLVAGARVQHLREKAAKREQTNQRTIRAARKTGVYVPPATRGRETTPDELRQLNEYLSLPAEEKGSE